MRRGVIHRAVVVALAGALAGWLVTGCSGADDELPEITFATGDQTVAATPTQHCDVDVQECDAYPQAAVTLAVPPGAILEVVVPGAVSEAPWQVVFQYRDPDGDTDQARSTVFADGQARYVLELDDRDAQLETVEVQQFGAAMVPRSDGVDFATRATWVLSIDDR